MRFEILGEISDIETFATGSGIRENCAIATRVWARALAKTQGNCAHSTGGIRLEDGSVHRAEVHWYEAAGIGRKEFKIKHLL